MPTVPRQDKCQTLTCKNTRAKLSSHCLEHGGKDTYKAKTTEERRQFNSMYDEPFWKRHRVTQLSRQPLCQACMVEGRIGMANHVDHLFSWSKLNRDAFFRNVWQSLCVEHHSHKTSLEHQGIYRHYTNGKHIDYQLKDYSFVLSRSEYHLPSVADTPHHE